ncbi:MGMT family protein [Planotetraspora silvatica]|nr:MGMT family protein [Planotetraspora silvatica]
MPPFEPIVTVYGPMVLPVVPCHRVVRSDGSLGGYAGGNHAEHALLTLEATP